MTSRPVPLALALAVALGAAVGCARDDQAPADVTAPATDAQAAADPHPAQDALAHDDAHAVDHVVGDFPVPENHQPWTPDAPLMEGMSRVRTAVVGLEAAPDEAAVAGHVAEVDEAIRYMFANCELEAEPDAALHIVLARLMGASRALQADPADTVAVAEMRAAVTNYEALFDDPAA